MSDIRDVENAIISSVATALFGNIGYQAGATATAVNVSGTPTIKLYRGWPMGTQLDTDNAAGITHVSLYTAPGAARSYGHKYFDKWVLKTSNTPTLTVSVSGNQVTFGGTGGLVNGFNQLAGIQVGINNYTTATWVLNSSDTPETVAAGLAGLLPSASANGAVVTVDSTLTLTASVVAQQQAYNETRRQCQLFRLCVWATSDQVRDAVASVIDSNMSLVRAFAMPDGDTTNIPVYHGTFYNDMVQKANIWRRDLVYEVEYATTNVQLYTPVLFIGGQMTLSNTGTSPLYGGVKQSD